MAKFNRPGVRAAASSPVATERTASGVTHEGAPGYARDAKGELFLLAVANMVGEASFYESAGDRDGRYRQLVRQVALEDPRWLLRMLIWLRADANMRSASTVGACEMVKARLDASAVPVKAYENDGPDVNRAVVNAACQRADEPGELLAYWTSTYGRAIPKPVKRGLGDAVRRLYTERSLLKYDSAGAAWRFGDVLDLVHPSPAADRPWQGELFKHALDRRHGRAPETWAEIPESLETVRNRAWLFERPVEDRKLIVRQDDVAGLLRKAGLTWEALAGWLQGPMDAAAWEAIIPSMGVMALARNLRNFDQAGVSDAVAQQVGATLADPEATAKSRMFPFRFLAAHKAAPSLRWAWPLEQALNHSLANVPRLAGRTLVLVDRSGSMFGGISEKSGLNRADSAAIFGTALAMRAAAADLVEFGTRHRPVSVRRGESLLKVLERFGNLGGTNTAEAVRANYRGHDRVVIVTDEQAWGGYRGADPTGQVPANVPVYTWNLAGYRYGHGPSGEGNRHVFGGLTDQAFRMIPLLEASKNATWPWLEHASA